MRCVPGLFAVPISTKPDQDGPIRYSGQEILRAIRFYAKRNRLDPAFLRAVILAESDFCQDVVLRQRANGLMLLMPDAAAMLQVADAQDLLQNIRGWTR